MNRSVWLGRILIIGGVLETAVGLGLLLAPRSLASFLLRSPLEGSGVVIAYLAGGGIVSLGIACWGARKTPTASASLGVSWAFLVYNIIACITLALSHPPLASGGLPALSASILHGVFGAALLGALLARDHG